MSFKLDRLKIFVYFTYVLIKTVAIIFFTLNMNTSKNLILSFESFGYYLKLTSDYRDYFLKHAKKE